MICTKFRYAHTERRIRVSTSPLSVWWWWWWWWWWWLNDDGCMKDFKLFHQGISHWVQYSRVGWGSQNQEWTWHPSKQIGRRWAQDHTGNIIGLCYLHWNLFMAQFVSRSPLRDATNAFAKVRAVGGRHTKDHSNEFVQKIKVIWFNSSILH